MIMKNSILVFTAILSLFIGSCINPNTQPEKTDNSKRNKNSIIEANEELFNKGNLSHAEKVFTDNYAGEGPERIKEHVGEIRTAFPDIKVSVNPILGEGNKTAWLRTHTGTHKGEFMGFQPTDKEITWQTMIISEYNEEGKVTKEWAVSDLFEVLQNARITDSNEED